MKILKFALFGPSEHRAYPLHAHSLPDQFRSEKSVFRLCGGSNRSEIDSQRSAVALGTLRDRWGRLRDTQVRYGLEKHENIIENQ